MTATVAVEPLNQLSRPNACFSPTTDVPLPSWVLLPLVSCVAVAVTSASAEIDSTSGSFARAWMSCASRRLDGIDEAQVTAGLAAARNLVLDGGVRSGPDATDHRPRSARRCGFLQQSIDLAWSARRHRRGGYHHPQRQRRSPDSLATRFAHLASDHGSFRGTVIARLEPSRLRL